MNQAFLTLLGHFAAHKSPQSAQRKVHTMSKIAILKASFELIQRSGAAKLLAPVWGGQGVIFCLHHVIPGGGLQAGFAPNNNLEITPEFLDELINLVKAKGYELLSLDHVVERLTSNSKNRFAVFTLDDGYKDNAQFAQPVFQKHNCPFTVYVAPRIAEGTCELWWRGLEAVIAKSAGFEFFGNTMPTTTLEQKQMAWKITAPKLQAMPEYEQRDVIKQLAKKHSVDLDLICKTAAMDWDEIRSMAQDPLATIGAHTLNHYNLLKLPIEDAKREIIESGKRIESELQKPVRHFAYPYGNKDATGKREFELAKSAGYQTAVVTRLGTVQSQHAQHLHALPRVMISGRYQNLRYIEALISGVPGHLANKFGALNVN
jgi:peptidoglycan/xylan/chitin deacetylase (PgdA/CDA1 family)